MKKMRKITAVGLITILLMLGVPLSAFSASFGFGQSAAIEPGTVFDEKGVRIDVVGLEYTGSGTVLTANIHNGTGTEISVLGGAVGYCVYSINGYMVSGGYVNEDIPAEESAEITMRFDDLALTMLGIDEIASMEIGFRFEDENDNQMVTGPIRIFTTAHEGYDYSRNTFREYVSGPDFERDTNANRICFHEEILAEGNGVAIASWGLFENARGELILMIEIRNSGDDEAYFHGTDFCINGLKVHSGSVCYEDTNPGATAICTITLTDLLEENIAGLFDIGEIGNVSFTARVYGNNRSEIIPEFRMLFPVTGGENHFNAEGTELYNANGVRVVYKTMYDGTSEYDDDIYAMFLLENNSGMDMDLSAEEVYLNGEEVSSSFSGDVEDGGSSAAELMLYSFSFEDYGIASAEDIDTMTVDFELMDSEYNTIDVFTVEVPVEGQASETEAE